MRLQSCAILYETAIAMHGCKCIRFVEGKKLELMCIGSSCLMTSIRYESHKTHTITNLQALVKAFFLVELHSL
jgi:hypothetical protein